MKTNKTRSYLPLTVFTLVGFLFGLSAYSLMKTYPVPSVGTDSNGFSVEQYCVLNRAYNVFRNTEGKVITIDPLPDSDKVCNDILNDPKTI